MNKQLTDDSFDNKYKEPTRRYGRHSLMFAFLLTVFCGDFSVMLYIAYWMFHLEVYRIFSIILAIVFIGMCVALYKMFDSPNPLDK